MDSNVGTKGRCSRAEPFILRGRFTSSALRDFGLSVIADVAEANSQMHHLTERARALGSLVSTEEDLHAWFRSVLAVRAASRGNFGVGAVLLDGDGAVVALGENQVFFPRFRSDAHAEMIAMDAFEAQYHQPRGLGKYVMLTSLESCPMCFARLITAGIGSIVHVSDDLSGGMIDLRSTFPQPGRNWLRHEAP